MTSEPLDTLVARRLREARIAAGMTVREAAAAAGIPDHSLLVRYENRKTRPPLDRLYALAEAYNTTLAALLAKRDEVVKLIAAIELADAQTLNRLLAALN